MANTDGMWTAETALPDFEVFVGPNDFKDASNVAALQYPSPGILQYNQTNNQYSDYVADLVPIFRKIGGYAPSLSQSQFGTAASQPGPSSVAGTTDASLGRGMPPYLGAKLPTLGKNLGPVLKGIQINSIDVIYYILTGWGPVNSFTIGLFASTFVDNTAPTANIVSLLPEAQNGLFLAMRSTIYKTNIPIPNPNFNVLTATNINLRHQVQAGGPCNFTFFGDVLHCSFNLN